LEVTKFLHDSISYRRSFSVSVSKRVVGHSTISPSDYDDKGPFSSLDEALELGGFASSTRKPKLSSDIVIRGNKHACNRFGIGFFSDDADPLTPAGPEA